MLNTASVAISLRLAFDAARRCLQRRRVGMRITDEIRAGEERAVVEARVVQPVGEDRVAAPGERGQDREIGEIPGREGQRLRPCAGANEGGKLGFERRVRREVAADEVRRARADAPARRAFARGRDDVRMIGETEIIVAREGDELAAIDDDARSLRRGERAPVPPQSRGFLRRESALEFGDQSLRHVAGVSPSFANSARSASTSGLPVVSSLSP